jgi:hypothetical protein
MNAASGDALLEQFEIEIRLGEGFGEGQDVAGATGGTVGREAGSKGSKGSGTGGALGGTRRGFDRGEGDLAVFDLQRNFAGLFQALRAPSAAKIGLWQIVRFWYPGVPCLVLLLLGKGS